MENYRISCYCLFNVIVVWRISCIIMFSFVIAVVTELELNSDSELKLN